MNSRPTDSTPEGQIKDLDLVQKRYDHEWDRARDLDGKAGHLLGYVTIITGLILGLGAFSIVERLFIPYFAGIASLLFSTVLISIFNKNISSLFELTGAFFFWLTLHAEILLAYLNVN